MSIYVEKFDSILKEESTCIMENFEVEKGDGEYKVSNNPFKLVFMKTTNANERELP